MSQNNTSGPNAGSLANMDLETENKKLSKKSLNICIFERGDFTKGKEGVPGWVRLRIRGNKAKLKIGGDCFDTSGSDIYNFWENAKFSVQYLTPNVVELTLYGVNYPNVPPDLQFDQITITVRRFPRYTTIYTKIDAGDTDGAWGGNDL